MRHSVLFFVFCCSFLYHFVFCEQEIWEKDMTNEIYIENANDGFEYVNLTCSDDKIVVSIKMEDDPEFGPFDGVFYTRGSFSAAKPPCFFDAKGSKNEVVRLEFAPSECQQKLLSQEKSSLVNVTVIVQNDDFLIFPGDLAFEIGCNFEGQVPVASIGLADPDPSAKELPKHRKSTFFPDDIRPRKKKETKKTDKLKKEKSKSGGKKTKKKKKEKKVEL